MLPPPSPLELARFSGNLPCVTSGNFSEARFASPLGPSHIQNAKMNDYLLRFNRQDVIFALKGVEQADFSSPTRTPDKLRTLFLANSDNKVLSGIINSAIMPATMLTTPLNQRGFCPGRQFCLNIVELDAFQRVYDQSYCQLLNLISEF